MSYCFNCGTAQEPTAKFCPQCGTPVVRGAKQSEGGMPHQAGAFLDWPLSQFEIPPARRLASCIRSRKRFDVISPTNETVREYARRIRVANDDLVIGTLPIDQASRPRGQPVKEWAQMVFQVGKVPGTRGPVVQGNTKSNVQSEQQIAPSGGQRARYILFVVAFLVAWIGWAAVLSGMTRVRMPALLWIVYGIGGTSLLSAVLAGGCVLLGWIGLSGLRRS